jgi:nucleotide-binding universal stress UspA family protein
MAAKPILAGIDGSEQSLRAVDWATREAIQRDAPLRIVSVIPLDLRNDWFVPPDPGYGRKRKSAESALADAADLAHLIAPGLTVDLSLRAGDPGPDLAALASRAAMLVVGSRGLSGVAAMALGSVGRYLAAHAPTVVVVDRDEVVPPCNRVVVGIRDVDDSEAPLGFAFDEAARRGAYLVAAQSWYWFRPPGSGATTASQVSAEALIRLFRLLEPWREKYPDVAVGEEIIHAHPGKALVKLSASADLLVLGRHRGSLSITDSPIGSITRSVLSRACCPVAIVPAS